MPDQQAQIEVGSAPRESAAQAAAPSSSKGLAEPAAEVHAAGRSQLPDAPSHTRRGEPPLQQDVTWGWSYQVGVQALWLRPFDQVEEEDYQQHYLALSKRREPPALHWHYLWDSQAADGPQDQLPEAKNHIKAQGVLYFPAGAPRAPGRGTLSLCIRGVAVISNLHDVFHWYLNFMFGIVDCPTLESRVTPNALLVLPEVLEAIRGKLAAEAVEALCAFAARCQADAEAGAAHYLRWWATYGAAILRGVAEDTANQQQLASLLRLHSTAFEQPTSLEAYLQRMQPGQDCIHCLAGTSVQEAQASPLLQQYRESGEEVLLLGEQAGRHLSCLPSFRGHALVSIDPQQVSAAARSAACRTMALPARLPSTAAMDVLAEPATKTMYEPLLAWWRELLGPLVWVEVCSCLSRPPGIVLQATQRGELNRLDRLAPGETRQRTVAPPNQPDLGLSFRGKLLLINPSHPLVQFLRMQEATAAGRKASKRLALLLYQTALIESGFDVPDSSDFADLLHTTLATSLDIPSSPSALLSPRNARIDHEFCYVKRMNRLVLSVTAHEWTPKVRMTMARHAGQEYARHCVVWHAAASSEQVDIQLAEFSAHELRLVFRYQSPTYLAALDFSSSEKRTFIEVVRKAAQQMLTGMGVPTAWMDGVYIGMD